MKQRRYSDRDYHFCEKEHRARYAQRFRITFVGRADEKITA